MCGERCYHIQEETDFSIRRKMGIFMDVKICEWSAVLEMAFKLLRGSKQYNFKVSYMCGASVFGL